MVIHLNLISEGFVCLGLKSTLLVERSLVNSRLLWECSNKLNTLKYAATTRFGNFRLEGNKAANELDRKGAEVLLYGPEPFVESGRGSWPWHSWKQRNE